jgi:hypothetical protein
MRQRSTLIGVQEMYARVGTIWRYNEDEDEDR